METEGDKPVVDAESAPAKAEEDKKNTQAEVEGATEKATPAEPEVPKYKAVILGSFGGAKHLRVDAVELKALGEHDVEIEVEACGVNFLDVMVRQGLVDQTTKPPFTMGSECVGTVVNVGDKVTTHKVGDRVVALVEHGAWTERLIVTVPEAPEGEANEVAQSKAAADPGRTALLLPCPAGLSAPKAAGLAFAYLPAWMLLHHVARIRDGDVLLVHSAGGGVGTAIGQLAKCIPNVKLVGTASKTKHEKLESLYDHLFSPDQDYVAEIKKLYPQGIDVILDCLGSEMSKTSCLLKPVGNYILYGMSNLVTGDRKNILNIAKHWIHAERINPVKLYEDNRTVGGFSLKALLFPRQPCDSTHQRSSETLVRQCWTELGKLIDQTRIDPWVDSEWNFDQVKESMLRLQERKNVGKVVLLPKTKAQQSST